MMISMSYARYTSLLDQSVGICTTCGSEEEQCEPDIRRRKCYACGSFTVYGLEWLLTAGDLDLTD